MQIEQFPFDEVPSQRWLPIVQSLFPQQKGDEYGTRLLSWFKRYRPARRVDVRKEVQGRVGGAGNRRHLMLARFRRRVNESASELNRAVVCVPFDHRCIPPTSRLFYHVFHVRPKSS